MALITTAFNVANGTMAMKITPYSGAGDMAKQYLGIPRAEVNFTVGNGAIPVATGGDTQHIVITCQLPLTFAYVLQEVSICGLAGVSAANWSNLCFSCITNFLRDGTNWRAGVDLFSRGVWSVDGDVTFNKSYFLGNPDQMGRLIIPELSANYVINLANNTADGSLMALGAFHARFLQYDISQAYSYPANTPLLVR